MLSFRTSCVCWHFVVNSTKFHMYIGLLVYDGTFVVYRAFV